ncbi:MAG: hypothetical protein HQL59_02800 [Magnetococcales bacterium]|nr:hypothetical protein [Magnetococcales bacterium]
MATVTAVTQAPPPDPHRTEPPGSTPLPAPSKPTRRSIWLGWLLLMGLVGVIRFMPYLQFDGVTLLNHLGGRSTDQSFSLIGLLSYHDPALFRNSIVVPSDLEMAFPLHTARWHAWGVHQLAGDGFIEANRRLSLLYYSLYLSGLYLLFFLVCRSPPWAAGATLIAAAIPFHVPWMEDLRFIELRAAMHRELIFALFPFVVTTFFLSRTSPSPRRWRWLFWLGTGTLIELYIPWGVILLNLVFGFLILELATAGIPWEIRWQRFRHEALPLLTVTLLAALPFLYFLLDSASTAAAFPPELTLRMKEIFHSLTWPNRYSLWNSSGSPWRMVAFVNHLLLVGGALWLAQGQCANAIALPRWLRSYLFSLWGPFLAVAAILSLRDKVWHQAWWSLNLLHDKGDSANLIGRSLEATLALFLASSFLALLAPGRLADALRARIATLPRRLLGATSPSQAWSAPERLALGLAWAAWLVYLTLLVANLGLSLTLDLDLPKFFSQNRMTVPLHLMAALTGVALLRRLPWRRPTAIAAGLALGWLLIVSPTLTPPRYPFTPEVTEEFPDHVAMARWARDHTPVDALFVADPTNVMDPFMFLSERPLLIYRFLIQRVIELRRMDLTPTVIRTADRLKQAFADHDPALLVAVMDEFAAPFLVLQTEYDPKSRERRLDPSWLDDRFVQRFANDHFQVYERVQSPEREGDHENKQGRNGGQGREKAQERNSERVHEKRENHGEITPGKGP